MIILTPHRMRGFTLLEVLVALVILSIGVLGLAAMQATALSSTHGSQTESMVVIQARSLADAMTANPDYWGITSPTFTVTGTPNNLTYTGNPPTYSGANCSTATCSYTDMAGYDLQQWANQLLTQVPGAKGSITCTGSAPVGCSITITWTQNSAAALNSGTANAAATTQMSYTLLNQI
ncbi:type IV pilus modification protein PilV [Dyella lipolytica]|uniref:Type IV pilus modification protein PilV n=1 Tax=Dyella lipolytica TaxID=1867835 RepID=A0ABW8ISE9_9GAMM|nr:type IV pilus modification protein PilV [Dyella lipolytica]GLQ46875.1 type IV pilus modification protein PilV [Dyella lipolytica]